MSDRGVLTVISGFSGAGKGTVVKQLLQEYDYGLSISATTRSPREGEQDGREYFFKTKEEFEKMIREHQLIEYAQYVGNYYGTPKEYVVQQLEQGKDVILEIEMQGALRVREILPEVNLIFLTPPTVDELERRLVSRGTETAEVIRERMARAKEESAYMKEYDYVVINDDLDECVENVHQLIRSLHYKREQQEGFIQKIKQEFEKR
ncbi:guanylate kinase [Roseburia sp. CAG:380]|jgi:guanylate kinase|uniref:guanylate kinase n=1 Tax=Roseburia sp. AM59-24XD TaxID=2293138 RepID=UPI00033894F2|nr:guanylate kinase [Roseburia sp. AM59-24XD]MBS5665930.1 guanylate kinase [Roseburia sp.]RHP83797.1 guanylate kinase [Roseburia sp. AM59-24XD]CDC94122.1 guanylate kinase [Roseburia sp. CAG:380]HCS15337.1 guanylate kinase [Lachnospiraceae bacterium]